jgi:hypothetical protein
VRGRRAAAWRMDDGRRTGGATVHVRGGPTRLRVTVGRAVKLEVRVRRRWLSVGRLQPLPRWGGGAHAALTMGGAERARARFDSFSIAPR